MNNINLSVVAQNRKPISIIGANLGTQYFKAEARSCDNNYAEKVAQIKANQNIEFYLNRVPRRFRMTGHEVISAQIVSDAVGATKVVLNNDDENSRVSIPVGANMEKIGGVTEDAINKALHGDKNIIFADPAKTAEQLNVLNRDEKARLMSIKAEIEKAIAQIDSAIAENSKKADIYNKEIISSTPEIIPTSSNNAQIEESVVVLTD